MKQRLRLFNTILALAALTVSPWCFSNSFPSRTINLLVPYKAGGGVDAYARVLTKTSRHQGGLRFAVINKPGAGGLNGAVSLLRARPDGHTLMLVSGSSFLLSALMRQTIVNPFESFHFVAQVGQLNTSLMVPANSPYTSVQALTEAIRDGDKSLRWGHSGRGSFHYLSGLGFLSANNLELQDVPFKGGAPARAALVSGQIDFGFIGTQQQRNFEQHIKVLAVNSRQRLPSMPTVATFEELGVPHLPIASNVILLAPKATPAAVVAQLQRVFMKLSDDPQYQAQLRQLGLHHLPGDGDSAKTSLRQLQSSVQVHLDVLRPN